jgi:hypothetical protein
MNVRIRSLQALIVAVRFLREGQPTRCTTAPTNAKGRPSLRRPDRDRSKHAAGQDLAALPPDRTDRGSLRRQLVQQPGWAPGKRPAGRGRTEAGRVTERPITWADLETPQPRWTYEPTSCLQSRHVLVRRLPKNTYHRHVADARAGRGVLTSCPGCSLPLHTRNRVN